MLAYQSTGSGEDPLLSSTRFLLCSVLTRPYGRVLCLIILLFEIKCKSARTSIIFIYLHSDTICPLTLDSGTESRVYAVAMDAQHPQQTLLRSGQLAWLAGVSTDTL